MKNLMKFAALGAALAVSAMSAHATSISGSISVFGAATTDGTTEVTFTNPATATLGTGSLALANGDLINMLSPLTAASVGNLFTTASGPDAISFLLSSLTLTPIAGGQMEVTGSGLLSEAGFTNTAAGFELTTASNGNSTFTLDATVAPEPSSLMLLGTGLSGMAGMFFRRRRSIA